MDKSIDLGKLQDALKAATLYKAKAEVNHSTAQRNHFKAVSQLDQAKKNLIAAEKLLDTARSNIVEAARTVTAA